MTGDTKNGAVEIIYNGAGDCNGDGTVNAADLSAWVLEWNDGDDNSDPNDAPNGTFSGSPFCDANENGAIEAGDLTCTVLVIFHGFGACQTTLASHATAANDALVTRLVEENANISIGRGVQAAGGKVSVPITFNPADNDVASLVFSIDYDESLLSLDNVDSISLTVPAGFTAASVTFDPTDKDGEIDVSVFDPSLPFATLPASTVMIINFNTVDVSSAIAAVDFAANPVVSAGNTGGQNTDITAVNGNVFIGNVSQVFLPIISK